MRRLSYGILLIAFLAGQGLCGQLVNVESAPSGLKTSLKRKENIIWMNCDRLRPVTITFEGDMRGSNFSTVNSRFYISDGKTLTSNLISPGGVAAVSFDNNGTYKYRVYGHDKLIEGEIAVGYE